MGANVIVSRVKIYNGSPTSRLSNSTVSIVDSQGATQYSYNIGSATGKDTFEFVSNFDLCDQLLQQFHRFDEELSLQGKWQGGSVTGVCRGWGTSKVCSSVPGLGRLGDS